MIKLIIFNASGRIGHFNCEADERVVTIGRQEDNKIVLAGDRRVSRRLCEIYYDRDRWRIADVRHRSNRFAGKGSDNQIVIMIQKAGQPDSDPCEISVGYELCNQDMILIAGFKIRVELLKDMDEEVPLDLLYELKPLNGRAKTPTVIQMEAVECGAASLSMVLGSYGLFIPLEELREECGVSRDGSKANNVLKAARKYGMNAKGYRYGLKKLFELKYPLILFWNFNHFVVLEGFRKGRVFVNDPAKGPRKISLEELDISFSGVVLTFEPGEKFEKGGVRSNLFGALLARMKGAETAIAYVVLCGLLLVIPGLVVPTFTRIFIDDYLIANDATLLKPLLLGMGLTAVIRMVLTGLQEHYLLRYESKLALISSSRFFEHILRLPISYFTQRFPGEIGSRVMINDKVAQVLSNQFTTTLLNTFMIFFYALIMFAYDWLLTVVCICLSTLNIVVVKLISRKRIDASRRVLQETGKLTGTAMNGLQLMETLKATGSENDFFARWSGYQAKVLKGEQELSLISNLVNAVPPLLETLITTVILALGGYQIMNGVLTVGMLVAYQALMKSFTNPLKNLVEFGGAIQELEGDMNRLDDVLRYPQDPQYTQEIRVADSIKNKTKLSGGVELKNITFGYSPLDKPLIEDFSLKVEPGKRVALVGGSGSGKSTVVRLLTGLYLPWSGEILFDGTRREEIPPSLLYSSIGIVDQDIFLFGASIRDNLTMWDSGVPDLNIISATRDAMIDEVIQTRASSYSSDMEEGGGNFSGGQRQRLEIARALVGFPTILLMDEATSALDPTTEKMINDNLRRRGCTCIIVAHRLSTIRDCDEIVVLQQGKIAERGTHETLLEKKGIYADLIED